MCAFLPALCVAVAQAPWLSLCKATDVRWSPDPVRTYSTFHPRGWRFNWPPAGGPSAISMNGNMSHANLMTGLAGRTVAEVARQRKRLCPDDQVFNPFDSTCRPQLPIFSLFPKVHDIHDALAQAQWRMFGGEGSYERLHEAPVEQEDLIEYSNYRCALPGFEEGADASEQEQYDTGTPCNINRPAESEQICAGTECGYFKAMGGHALEALAVATEKSPHKSRRIVRDWLGNIRPWAWDCEPNTYHLPYSATNPQRMFDCMGRPHFEHIMEEEYFEWAVALMAAASARPGDKFVAVEVGARYAPWAMRAVTAAKMLGVASHFHVVTVEPSARHNAWIREHFQINGMDAAWGLDNLTMIQGMFCDTTAKYGAPPSTTYGANCMANVLAGVDHVDFLDIDAQGAEKYMLSRPADRAAFKKKVRRAHIETHSDNMWRVVVTHLHELGFRIERGNTSWMYTAYESQTGYGPVWWRGGGVTAFNPALVPC